MSSSEPTGTSTTRSQRAARRGLFWLVDAAVLLYLILDVVAQLLPPHYNPINTPESDLAVGPYGYIMTLNFVDRGLLSLAFLYGLVRTLRLWGVETAKYRGGLVLLGVWGVGALLLALFPTDVPATPLSWHGAIHLAVALLAFLGGALGALRISLQLGGDPALQDIRRLSLPAAAAAFLFLLLLFGLPLVVPHVASSVGGVTERVLIGSILVWILAVSTRLGRSDGHAGPT